jgi:hypothetical protein
MWMAMRNVAGDQASKGIMSMQPSVVEELEVAVGVGDAIQALVEKQAPPAAKYHPHTLGIGVAFRRQVMAE